MSPTTLQPRRIRAEIMLRYGTLGAFETTKGLKKRSVSDVLRGRSSKPTEIALARELGVELHAISSRHSAYQRDESTNVDDSGSENNAHRLIAEAR